MRFTKFAADRQLIDLFESYPEKLDGRTADWPAASAAGPALLGRVQPQGASRRSASHSSVLCAGRATAASAAALLRPISPTAARLAKVCAST